MEPSISDRLPEEVESTAESHPEFDRALEALGRTSKTSALLTGGGACLIAAAITFLAGAYYQKDEQVRELRLATSITSDPSLSKRLATIETQLARLNTTASLVFLQAASSPTESALPVSRASSWTNARAALFTEGTLGSDAIRILAKDPKLTSSLVALDKLSSEVSHEVKPELPDANAPHASPAPKSPDRP
jgi:hypothetical protein